MNAPLGRAGVTCDHEGCESYVVASVVPGNVENADAFREAVRKAAEAAGWAIDLPGDPGECPIAEPPPGYGEPAHRSLGTGRDLCPLHRDTFQ